MRRKLRVLFIGLTLSVGPTQAHAANAFGIPDSDTAMLTAMLLEAVKSSAELSTLVESTQKGIETAQATLAIARATTDAVGSTAALLQDPTQVFGDVYEGFRQTFPEVEALWKEAEGLNQALQDPLTYDGQYNPYAMQTLIRSLREGGDSMYTTLVAIDAAKYNLTDEHLLQAKEREELRTGVRRFKSFLAARPEGINPQEAAVMTAKATLNQLEAQIQMAESLNELATMQKNEYLAAKEAAANSQALRSSMMGDVPAMLPGSMDLDAFEDEEWRARGFVRGKDDY